MITTSLIYMKGDRKIKRCKLCNSKITGNNYLKYKVDGYLCITCSKKIDRKIVKENKQKKINSLVIEKSKLLYKLKNINEQLRRSCV